MVKTMRHDSDNWNAEVWARVYRFPRRKGEGWAGHQDEFHVGKFRTDPDPKDGFHPGNYRNHRKHRVLEFMFPIFSPKKPKRVSLTMAKTLFGAMSGVRHVNWGIPIHVFLEKSLPHIRWKPSFFSPYILYLYEHCDCFTTEEEDMLTIAEDEVMYKLGPEVEVVENGTEDSSDPTFSKELLVSPTPSFQKLASPPPPPPRLEVGPSREAHSKAWIFQPRIFGSPLQEDPQRVGGAANVVLLNGAHHQGNKPGFGQLRTWKHSQGVGEAGRAEED